MEKQSELGSLIHFVKSCLASGILAIPYAFSNGGILFGTIGTILIAIICTHCAYILVVCAQELRKKSSKTVLTFGDISEEACLLGPPTLHKYHLLARNIVDLLLFATYFGICSAYSVIIAKTVDKVITYYWFSINIRIYIALLLLPFVLLSYTPNLKLLTPISMLANIFLGLGLGITVYYLIKELHSATNIKLIENVERLPKFFGAMIFSLETIGSVMIIENNMLRPQKFVGKFGVLNQGMLIITIVHLLIGILGYLCFGDQTEANITLNLPNNEYLSLLVQIFIALSVYGTFGIQFFVCLQIAWENSKYSSRKANYVLRTILVVMSVALALVVPTIGPFISLIGALCFSTTGILFPIIIEIITFWEQGFGRYHWILIKDVIVFVVSVLALIIGTKDAIIDIIHLYV